MITVKATREGLVGDLTASGYRIDPIVPFVALPSTRALKDASGRPRAVRVCNPLTGLWTVAIVLDVGPWNEHDDPYVFQPATRPGSGPPTLGEIRPAAESGVDTRGRITNHAGIDLGERVYFALGMKGNTVVSWEFVL